MNNPNAFSLCSPIFSLDEFLIQKSKFGRLIVASGGFDPIHSGHISYLNGSKLLGGSLIVIVNGNGFLRKKKKNYFLPLSERARIISSLKFVDAVITYEVEGDMTVCNPLEKIKPDVFANGGDRENADSIPEWSICLNNGIEIITNVDRKGYKTSSSSILYRWLQLS